MERAFLHVPCARDCARGLEVGRRRGWAVRRTPRTSFATQAVYTFHSGAAPFIFDKSQIKCNSSTIGR